MTSFAEIHASTDTLRTRLPSGITSRFGLKFTLITQSGRAPAIRGSHSPPTLVHYWHQWRITIAYQMITYNLGQCVTRRPKMELKMLSTNRLDSGKIIVGRTTSNPNPINSQLIYSVRYPPARSNNMYHSRFTRLRILPVRVKCL